MIGALELEPPGQGILPHEQTMPKPKGDRLYLLRATDANLSPIWGLSLASGLSALIPPTRWRRDPSRRHRRGDARALADHRSGRGRRHRRSVGSAPVVIADGHHRFETALAYQEERRAASGRAGGYDFVMALVVELADEQLSVRAIHRLDQPGCPTASTSSPGVRAAPSTSSRPIHPTPPSASGCWRPAPWPW